MFTNTKLTIGEMARMHRIPESTLRYYDEKGIFHPSIVDPKTQYRYYTVDQFFMLDTIKFLRHLGISLKQIKQYVDERSPAKTLDILTQQKRLLEQKQQEIALTIAKMDHNIRVMTQAMTGTSHTVEFKRIPKRMITSVTITPDATDEMMEYYIYSLQNNAHLHDVSLFVGAIGVTVSKEGLLKGNYRAYNSVFINVNDMSPLIENRHVIEEGVFACSYHQGPYDQTKETYDLLLQAIEAQNYEVMGDSIEQGLIDLSMTNNPNDYISEIQIPVRER
ncbi:MerR family transcriptional regulator [Paenibacillus sp. SC116]|uniref:MerR family transcriptional regulator n=1 Tax=Paenibacillus sp. SC116 TaxID=2968986 RepID=UPI00215A3389|nr:MerR family transcriptional regulator [Paenibacillus sp. SC116]MCR8845941.1 MerR family transcriptional regulator [Paenibacillus sp. SC116]